MNGLSAAVRRGAALAWRHRWAYTVPVASLLAAVAVWVVHQKDTFKASSVVNVLGMSRERGGSSLLQASEERSEQVMMAARNKVLADEHVAAAVRVLRPTENAKDPMILAQGRMRIAFDQLADATFAVSIVDTVPARAADAVNAVLDSFLARERDERRRDAVVLRDGRAAELAKAEADRDARKAELDAFEAEHTDTLPERKEAVAGEIARLEMEIRDRESQATNARRLVQEYDKTIRQAPQAMPSSMGVPQSAEEAQLTLALAGEQKSIDDANTRLAELRARYQEKWPAIEQMKQEISVLEGRMAKTKTDLDEAHRRAEAAMAQRKTNDAQGIIQTLQAARDSVAAEERRATEAAEAAGKRLVDLQKRQAQVPTTARGLRDVKGRADDAYHEFERRKTAFDSAREAVGFFDDDRNTEKVTGFRVESRAMPPALPSGPPRTRYLAGAVLLGLVIGYGLVLARRRFDDVAVTRPDDLADLVPSALRVGVPLLGDARPPDRAIVKNALLTAWVLGCFGVAAFAIASYKGWIVAPDWFRPWIQGA